jgi:parvulin-like peptidyl-prolyl isomerase
MKPHVVVAAALLVAACHSTAAPTAPSTPGAVAPAEATDATPPATAAAPASPTVGLPRAEGWSAPDPAPAAQAGPVLDLDSHEILDRTKTAEVVLVKHVLIAWRELEGNYGGQMDTRAKARDNAAAAALAQSLAAKLRAAPDQIDALAKEHSEDPGSQSGEPYEVAADKPFVEEFKALALRLNLHEVGIVKTAFGYHVVVRVPPPPPDPLEPAKILARPATAGPVRVQHVLIGWRDVPAAAQRPVDPRAEQRSKADADVLAKAVLAKVKAGGNMAELMKQYSEDPGSKDSGKDYEVTHASPFVEPFKRLALRLRLGEAAMIRSTFGWHVMKRIAPPPLDRLESSAILRREPVTAAAKVKHILLSYDQLTYDSQDPRGAKRTRAELEALVKQTVAALRRKAAIEPLMAELSEDPGSAASGTSYDATPDASLVAPFKALSLRLKVGEVGVVKTEFGFHIIQRTE